MQEGSLAPSGHVMLAAGHTRFRRPMISIFVIDRIYNLRWDLTKSFNLDFKAVNNSRVDEPVGRIDTKAKKDSVWKNFFSGGRNTLYNQGMDLTYNLPLAMFPALDWVTGSLTYRTTYGWIGASRLAVSLGNTIQNSNQKGGTFEFNLVQLYNKSRMLRSLNTPVDQQAPPPPPEPSKNPKDSTAKVKRKQSEGLHGFPKTAAQLLTMIKRIGATYNEGASTFIPGYMDSTQFLGQNLKSNEPGFDFIFGKQPDINWLQDAASKGLISRDPFLNNLFRQTYDQRFSLSASLEPFRDFAIDLNMDKTFSRTYSSLFKDTTGAGTYANLNPYAGGGFSISYISFQTLFRNSIPIISAQTFKQFEDNRIIFVGATWIEKSI